MKRLILILLIISFLGSSCKEDGSSGSGAVPLEDPHARPPASELWEIHTPAGIYVITDKSTIVQYESLWGWWGNINWGTLDELFDYYKDYYCGESNLNWNCKDAHQSQLTVYIKPWDPRCKDEETPTQPKEIYAYLNGQYQCIDGWYWVRTIYLHLGDDPGWDHETVYQEEPLVSELFYAFTETSYPHEIMHLFQDIASLPYSESSYMGNVVMGSTIIGYRLILPDEEEE